MFSSLTPKLRTYLVSHHGMSESASLADAKALVGELIAAGKMTTEKLKELAEIKSAETIKQELQSMVTKAVGDALAANGGHQTKQMGGIERLMSTNTGTDNVYIRVKDESEKYMDVKTIARHRLTGQPVEFQGSHIYTASEKELARIGVWFKHWLRKNAHLGGQNGIGAPAMSEHEENLLAEMRAKGRWAGKLAGDRDIVGLTLGEMYGKGGADDVVLKALLDDSTSGGQYLIPNDFDAAVLTYPLLHSELLPRVDIRTTTRQTIDSAAIGNPTVAWGGSDASVTLFTTTSMVSQLQTQTYDVVAAIEFGRDTISDSPVDVGAKLVENYGQVFAKELDDVIANGVDASSQPEGIFQASGTETVNSENGSTGPWTVADLEALMFGIGKQYVRPELNPCYISNLVTYSRIRGIEVGTSDQRRVLGMDHQSFQTLGFPHLINNDLANGQLGFGAMKKYALYRRAGLNMELVSGGKTLSLANTSMIVARARYGGQYMDGNAFAVISDGQS